MAPAIRIYRRIVRLRTTSVARMIAMFASLAFVFFICHSSALHRKRSGVTHWSSAAEVPGRRLLLVLYSYFEEENTPSCEITMKRVNLYFFLKNAVYESADTDFVFTFSGHVPSGA